MEDHKSRARQDMGSSCGPGCFTQTFDFQIYTDKRKYGRTQNKCETYTAPLGYDSRHPMLLPKQSKVTKLILKQYHEMNLHLGGYRSLQAKVNEQYWIPSGVKVIMATGNNCMTCHIAKAKSSPQRMAPLPDYQIEVKPVHKKLKQMATKYQTWTERHS